MQAAVPCLCSCTSSHFSAPLLVLFAREDFTRPELQAHAASCEVFLLLGVECTLL